jgi:hypothetical protein
MSWEKIASQSASSASKATMQIASQALEDFLSEEENCEKIVESVLGSVATTKNDGTKSEKLDQLFDD